MRFLVFVENRPDTEAARKALHPAHLDFIARHPEVLIAGSAAGDQAGLPIEGAWIVEAPDRSAVSALMQAEPFFVNGLRSAIRICEFGPPPMFDHLFTKA